MKKTDIINRIKEMLKETNDFFAFFPCNTFTFHYDYGKYDMMSVYIEDDELMIESVGYSSFGLKYLNADNLSYNTLKKIMNNFNKEF